MSITEIPALDRTSATFKADLNTLFGVTIPAFSVELNTEIDRLNTLGAGSYSGTSTTSLTIGTGDKALAIGTGKGFVTGQYVSITDPSGTNNYMRGVIKTYDASNGALVVAVDAIGGSGTKTAWVVGLQAVASADIQLDSLVELTSGTSWTCPAGVRRVKLTMSGGGGSGSRSGNAGYAGADGAAGGVVIATFAVTAGQSYAYTIGAGGASAGVATGNAGANSTFKANAITYTANGGGAGTGGTAQSVGGGGSGTGAVVLTGGNGMFSAVTTGPMNGGGVNALGKSGGYGSTNSNSGAGVNGKIILELYK